MAVRNIADVTCPLPRATSPAPALRVSAWLLPDIALFTAFITLFFCLFLFDGTQKLFRDSDAGWHIRTGEAILSGSGLPREDSYSLTRSGQPWFAWEWGADVIMAAFHRAGGLAYVAGLYAVAIAACTWLWFQLHWSAGGNFLFAGGMAALMLSTGNIHWLARPHVFSWLLLLLWLGLMRTPAGPLFTVALLSALWANLHASFFLATAIAILYAASSFLTPLIWDVDRAAEWTKAKWYAQAAAVSLMATLLNPYGWSLHAHVLQYLSNKDLLDRIGEFQSFNFHAEGAAQILLTIAVAAIGGVLALCQRRLADFLMAALFLAMALRSARVLPLVALLILPLANGAITAALRQARNLQPRLRNMLDAFLTYGDNLRRIDARQSGIAWVPLVIAGLFLLLGTPGIAARAGFPPDQFPVNEAEEIAKLPPNARILAPDMYGGYLIYRFNGSRKVFFDGRSDFYGPEYMKEYLRLIELREGWQAQIRDFGFTHALLPLRYSLAPALEQAGWKRLHSGKVAVLLEKN